MHGINATLRFVALNPAKIRKTILAKIAKLQEDLAALDRLSVEYGSSLPKERERPALPADAHSDVAPLPFDDSKASLAQSIREAYESFGTEPFTKQQVLARLKEKFPAMVVNEASVASFLARLGKAQKGIIIIQQGSGKQPSKYQVLNAKAEPENFDEP